MRTAEEMRTTLENWESSGLNQKAFAAREGISSTVLQYWRRRLKEGRSRGDVQDATAW